MVIVQVPMDSAMQAQLSGLRLSCLSGTLALLGKVGLSFCHLSHPHEGALQGFNGVLLTIGQVADATRHSGACADSVKHFTGLSL